MFSNTSKSRDDAESGKDWASLIAQLVKNLPAMQETWVRFLVWEDPLEKEMATYSSILAYRIPWTDSWQATVHEVARFQHDLATNPPPPQTRITKSKLRLARWKVVLPTALNCCLLARQAALMLTLMVIQRQKEGHCS